MAGDDTGTGQDETPGDDTAQDETAQDETAQDQIALDEAGQDEDETAQDETGPDQAGTAGRGLKIHHLRPARGAHTSRTRVGRGEASKGKTAGRGTKGTKARGQVAPGFEGGQMPLHRRLPQLKGFSNAQFTVSYQVVNTGRLAQLYPGGGEVTVEDLAAKGAVRAGEPVKVLGNGQPADGLQVSAHAFSASAVQKITAAGGTIRQL